MLHLFIPLKCKFDVFSGSYALIAEISIISEAHSEKSVFVGKLHLTLLYSVRQCGTIQKY